MNLGIAGRKALVTGGSAGIGRAIARALAAEGVNVAITARTADRLTATAREIQVEFGVRAVPVPGDLSKAEECDRVCAAAADALGGIDILVNNAGAARAGPIGKVDDDAWAAGIDLKLMGYARCTRALMPGMRARKWGRIVNIVGRRGRVPGKGFVVGGAVNAALLNLTGALSLDGAADNVLVNAINPGPILTDRARDLLHQKAQLTGDNEDAVKAKVVARVPLARYGTPEEIAAAAAFLCSERAGYITGAMLDVDGGGAVEGDD